ncbi:MAG TPA: aldo/keto reductase [Mucilaginibacter sp.]|nr:aldo/keto reductase [Mucilaginibacter sp.]
MLAKLAIGTVQFGLNYGISNMLGQVSPDEAGEILNYAAGKGAYFVDTAQAYGNSENVLGQFSDKYPLVFITKLKPDLNSDEAVVSAFNSSMEKLKVDSVYGLLYHDFQSFLNYPASFKILNELKDNGKIKKIGFSLYHPEEIEYLLKNKIVFDIIQCPYNIFDRRFEIYFETLKQLGIEIHVRSVFLQGIIFLDKRKLGDFFNGFKSKLDTFQAVCDQLKTSPGHLALQFVAANKFIDKIVLGIQSLKHLKINISWLEEKIEFNGQHFTELKEDNLDFIIPSNWKL